jgi:hypothetical protein
MCPFYVALLDPSFRIVLLLPDPISRQRLALPASRILWFVRNVVGGTGLEAVAEVVAG